MAKYLSYSRMMMWEKSPAEYARVYILGGKSFQNAEMVFGSRVADSLETKEPTGDKDIDRVLDGLPKLDRADEFTKVNVMGIPVLARMDTANIDYTRFYEYKTGKTPWTQRKVDNADQLTFYAMVCWTLTGKLPEEIKLIWVQTEGNGKGIKCTGEVKEFTTKRTVLEIAKMMKRVKEAWTGIHELELDTLL